MVGRLSIPSRFLLVLWALPVGLSLGWLANRLLDLDIPVLTTSLRWSPLVLWPLSWLLSLRFHQSRFSFSLLLTAMIWFISVGGGPAGGHLLRETANQALLLVFPLLFLVISSLGGRGVFTVRATGFWLLLGVTAALWGALAHGMLPPVRHALGGLGRQVFRLPGAVSLSVTELIYLALALSVVITGWLRAHLSDGWAPLALTLGFIALHWGEGPYLAPYWSVAALLACLTVVQEAYRLAYLDALTGLPGRRALEEYGGSLGRNYMVAMADIDHFKQFNDTYGHDVGDQVLRMVAGKLKGVRAGGRAFRYGGEEFTLIFAANDVVRVADELERLRQVIEEARFTIRGGDRPVAKAGRKQRGRPVKGAAVKVTLSLGLAARNDSGRDLAAVIKAADKALYKAKRKGRNRVELA